MTLRSCFLLLGTGGNGKVFAVAKARMSRPYPTETGRFELQRQAGDRLAAVTSNVYREQSMTKECGEGKNSETLNGG